MSRKFSIPSKKDLINHFTIHENDIQNSAVNEIVKFPKLTECAHFHYETVELKDIKIVIENENIELDSSGEFCFYAKIVTANTDWAIRRSINSFKKLDEQLHHCTYDREYSQLTDLKFYAANDFNIYIISSYLHKFTQLLQTTKNLLTCAPILNWMQMDNKGRQLIAFDGEAQVNIPAVAASQAIKAYIASEADELTFNIGDIISIIDMPLKSESSWWRGKKDFKVGFFPSDHVELIGTTTQISASMQKLPVLEKRGKFVSLLLSFVANRPNRLILKKSGIVKERVFGCDLAEYLTNTQQDVPFVVKCCIEAIEKVGLVAGIYRQSGVLSNVQRLRNEFDADRVPDLNAPEVLEDIHCLGSLLKMYFRELPNPLLTYQLYDKFSDIASESQEGIKLAMIKEVARLLPPPYYRTCKYLFAHLQLISTMMKQTQMDIKNLAIVWAPNLLRRTTIGVNAIKELGIQSNIIQLFIVNHHSIFSEQPIDILKLDRPKSMTILPTSPYLISLEEAQLKQKLMSNSTSSPSSPFEYSNLKKVASKEELSGRGIVTGGQTSSGGGVESPAYHTVISLRKKPQQKGGNLLNFWNILRSQQNLNTYEFYSETDAPEKAKNITPPKVITGINSPSDIKPQTKFNFDCPPINQPIEDANCLSENLLASKSIMTDAHSKNIKQPLHSNNAISNSPANNLENNMGKTKENIVLAVANRPHVESQDISVKSFNPIECGRNNYNKVIDNMNLYNASKFKDAPFDRGQDSLKLSDNDQAAGQGYIPVAQTADCENNTVAQLRNKFDHSCAPSKEPFQTATRAMSKFLEESGDEVDADFPFAEIKYGRNGLGNAFGHRNAYISPPIDRHGTSNDRYEKLMEYRSGFKENNYSSRNIDDNASEEIKNVSEGSGHFVEDLQEGRSDQVVRDDYDWSNHCSKKDMSIEMKVQNMLSVYSEECKMNLVSKSRPSVSPRSLAPPLDSPLLGRTFRNNNNVCVDDYGQLLLARCASHSIDDEAKTSTNLNSNLGLSWSPKMESIVGLGGQDDAKYLTDDMIKYRDKLKQTTERGLKTRDRLSLSNPCFPLEYSPHRMLSRNESTCSSIDNEKNTNYSILAGVSLEYNFGAGGAGNKMDLNGRQFDTNLDEKNVGRSCINSLEDCFDDFNNQFCSLSRNSKNKALGLGNTFGPVTEGRNSLSLLNSNEKLNCVDFINCNNNCEPKRCSQDAT